MAGDPYFDDVICLLHLDATGATASDFPAVVGPDWDSGNGATLTNDNDPVWGNALNNCTEDSSNIKATSGWTSVPDMSAFTLDIDYTPDDFNDIAALFCW